MPTIDALVTEAVALLATGDPQVTRANLVTWWNDRQRTLASAAKWWFMRGNQSINVTLAGGTGPYALTGTPQNIEEVLYSATPLPSIPISQGTIFFSGAGSPKAYGLAPANAGQVPPSLYIFPAPDQTYAVTVYTFARLADLADGSGQVNAFTDLFPELVKAGMCWTAAIRMQEPDLIKQWKDEYREHLLPLLQQQSQFDVKGIEAEPHPSYIADAAMLGGGGMPQGR